MSSRCDKNFHNTQLLSSISIYGSKLAVLFDNSWILKFDALCSTHKLPTNPTKAAAE